MPDPHSSEPGASSPLARNNTVDAVVATLLFGVGVVVVVEARRLGAGWTTDGPGAGYFPFYIGLLMCIASVGVFCQALFSKARDTGSFVNREQAGRVLSVLLPAIVYVFVTVFLGLYVASAIYIALFMRMLGKYSVPKSVLVAVIVNAVFFTMFEVWFKVPLYKGKLDLLSFLGY